MEVQTVLGPIPVDDLGMVLPHEHVVVDLYRVRRRRDLRLNDPDLMTEELTRYREAGGRAVVDVTPPDLGRDPSLLREISLRSGVHVVMGTGRYREPWYERSLWERSTANLAAEFVAEIVDGVDGVRAGIIGEIGADGYSISPAEERVHRAAARAQQRTGLPIVTHAFMAPVGLAQLDIFAEEKADLTRVAVGHCDSVPDIRYHEAILGRGAYVEFDLIRGTHEYETQQQASLIMELISRGWAHKLLLSHDICSTRHLAAFGGNGFAYIPLVFAERLRADGVPQAAINQILVENPHRLLSGQG